MSVAKIVIVGTGGHAQMVWANWKNACSSPEVVQGWLESPDYDGPETLMGLPVFRQTPDGFRQLQRQGIEGFYFGIGMVRATPNRQKIYDALCENLLPKTFIHPTATISPTAHIGPGCYIGAQSIVQPFANIGAACIINTGAIVEHHVTIGQNTHLAPGAIVCGNASVGDNTMLGAGSVIIQDLPVGKSVTVGAGSVVTRPVPSGITVVGNPARNITP